MQIVDPGLQLVVKNLCDHTGVCSRVAVAAVCFDRDDDFRQRIVYVENICLARRGQNLDILAVIIVSRPDFYGGMAIAGAFLVVFTINPLVFLVFTRANIMQQANTPVKAHRVINHAKTINRYLYLMALCFLLVDFQKIVAEWLQKICLSQGIATSDADSWQWPWPCVPNLLLSPSLLDIDVNTVMTGVQFFVRYSVGYFLSYFVTVLALVDQLLINVFMLWEHDGYMADDRDVHDLSFLYAKSLYDIRNRSESMLSATKQFLATDRSRIDWIRQLEGYKAAFDSYDTNGDGSIQRQELEHVLARLTFDGGTEDGRACRCKTCTEWSQCTTVTRVDWNAFHRQFAAHDNDSSGELEFGEIQIRSKCTCHILYGTLTQPD